MATIERYGDKYHYDDTPEMHKAVFDYLIENYFKKYGPLSGEGIMQDDDAQIYAPVVLGELCDEVIQFKWEEDE